MQYQTFKDKCVQCDQRETIWLAIQGLLADSHLCHACAVAYCIKYGHRLPDGPLPFWPWELSVKVEAP